MTTGTAIALIGVILTAVSLLGVLIGNIMKLTEKITTLKNHQEEIRKDLDEQAASHKEKFRELYAFKESTNVTLSEIRADTKNILTMLQKIEARQEGR